MRYMFPLISLYNFLTEWFFFFFSTKFSRFLYELNIYVDYCNEHDSIVSAVNVIVVLSVI